MNTTLLKTHKVQCQWIPDVRISGMAHCRYRDPLAIHCIRISDFAMYTDDLKQVLDENELLRSVNYLMEKDTTRFIVARGILRLILGKYLGKRGADIQFGYESNLKPKLKNSRDTLHFNVTHSGDRIMIAVSTKPVGIDIEIVDEEFGFDQILDVTFDPKELEFIQKSHNRSEAFFLLWTRKEALLKATGKGIDDDLPYIPSLTGSHVLKTDHAVMNQSWNVGSFGIDGDYIASLAYHPHTSELPLMVYQAGLGLLD